METDAERPPKAYQNSEFLHSEDARVIRILSEYLEPANRLKSQRVKDTIVFFGSARILPVRRVKNGSPGSRSGSNRMPAKTSRPQERSRWRSGRFSCRVTTKTPACWRN